jgi:hypothetical protein
MYMAISEWMPNGESLEFVRKEAEREKGIRTGAGSATVQ